LVRSLFTGIHDGVSTPHIEYSAPRPPLKRVDAVKLRRKTTARWFINLSLFLLGWLVKAGKAQQLNLMTSSYLLFE